MIDLLNMLRYKSESTDIDFKSAQYRFNSGTEADKSELLKDILAIANSWRDGIGYILLGFKDQRPHPAEVVGIQDSIDDSRIQQFVNSKVKPKLTFRYEEHLYEEKTIGVIIIPKQKRPFYLASPYGKLKSNVVYVRRGSSTDEAEPVETIAMANEDSGRGDLRIELSLLAPGNEELPNSFAHTYLQFTEKFPDFEKPRKPRGPFDPPESIGAVAEAECNTVTGLKQV
ncbi:ATP-binding protein, partial [Pseudomonas aeruginosa]|uniref:AlbA family DNA-binding domain-containing protein n=1 Tax=Pseudomonas aeruginosa TaxID=287 RepID=UPI003005F3A6